MNIFTRIITAVYFLLIAQGLQLNAMDLAYRNEQRQNTIFLEISQSLE